MRRSCVKESVAPRLLIADLSCDHDHRQQEPAEVSGAMASSDWLARHRSAVWVAAVFLGPVVAALLTLARPQLHENHVTLILVLAVAVVSAAGLRPAGLVAASDDCPRVRLFLDRALLQLQDLRHPRHLDRSTACPGGRRHRAAQLVGRPSACHGRSPARLPDRPAARRRTNSAGDARSSARGHLRHSEHCAGCGQLST